MPLSKTASGVFYPTPLDSTCNLWLDFDDNYPSVIDKSSSHNNGTLVSSPPFAVGLNGMAVDCDGAADYVNCGTAIGVPSLCTTLAWIKFDTAPYRVGVISKALNSNEVNYYLGTGSGTAGLFLIKSAGTQSAASGTTVLGTTNWCQMVGSYDGSKLSFYLNGTIEETAAQTAAVATGGTTYVGLGQPFWASGSYLDGKITNVRIFNRVLTSQEIYDDYQRYKR